MAVTPFQADILKLLAVNRRNAGEAYVAGGVALNQLIRASRLSRDIDLFHDTESALSASWATDRSLLQQQGFLVQVQREAPAFVEAVITKGPEHTAMQWARDSAYRFFPLIEDDLMGLTLHPIDLATNKVLAMAGRLEVRDWIDVLNCDERLQPFGYLVWAACGKDPGFNPKSLLGMAARLHYSQAEVDSLDFAGERPDAADLGRHWHAACSAAARVCAMLPSDKSGNCVLDGHYDLYRGSPDSLEQALEHNQIEYHEGRIGGSWPTFIPWRE